MPFANAKRDPCGRYSTGETVESGGAENVGSFCMGSCPPHPGPLPQSTGGEGAGPRLSLKLMPMRVRLGSPDLPGRRKWPFRHD